MLAKTEEVAVVEENFCEILDHFVFIKVSQRHK